ncbi:hypothetical protein [Pantoea ananatis]|uniref:hypothetical protein n=1 Tax=Pantoea ananas TaxID=553 RepID=UPI001B303792|nr:hypothetical protein [Pantoea ananatis]
MKDMKPLHSSLIILDLFKNKFERDMYLIEFSVDNTKKYGKKYHELYKFNRDLKQSLFLKQIIDVCAFLDEINAFRSNAKGNDKLKGICNKIKPAINRIEEVQGLRKYRNVLAAHNFRSDKDKENVVLLSDYTKNPDSPNSTSELFFLSALCTTIVEAINADLADEFETAKKDYYSRLVDDKDDPLRGTRSLREAYDLVDVYRMKLGLQPKFFAFEVEEFNMALKKIDWGIIPKEFELSEDNFNHHWCIVLDMYLRMRNYKDIEIICGKKGSFSGGWLEAYGHDIAISERVYIFKHGTLGAGFPEPTVLEMLKDEDYNIVYGEIMRNVAP